MRRLWSGDAAFIVELVNDPDWLRFIGDRQVRTLADARSYIAGKPTAMYATPGLGLHVVSRSVDPTPLGLCGLIRRDGLDDVDLGFAFLPRFRGHGYAREAAAAVMAHGRDVMGLRRIVAITLPQNLPSIRLLDALGLHFERMIRLPGGDEDLRLHAWSG
jgi:RimJ/RimL family protein N-acetyltransferase